VIANLWLNGITTLSMAISPIIIPSKNSNKFSNKSDFLQWSYKLYSTKLFPVVDNNSKLNPNFVTGFADGESTFGVFVDKNSALNLGWRIRAKFRIELHIRDIELLYAIKHFFNGVGHIRLITTRDLVAYEVERKEELINVVIPHFIKYPLISQKAADFELFKLAVEMIKNKEHLTKEGLLKIINIKASLNKGLSEDLKKAFPNYESVLKSDVILPDQLSPYWITGFITGEGCFTISKSTSQFRARLVITQHSRDLQLFPRPGSLNFEFSKCRPGFN